MGILIVRDDEPELFEQANEEAQRLIRVSDEVRMTFDKVKRVSEENAPHSEEELEGTGKLSTSRLAKKLGLKTQELTDHLLHLGAIEISDGQKQITPLGRRLGGELRVAPASGRIFSGQKRFRSPRPNDHRFRRDTSACPGRAQKPRVSQSILGRFWNCFLGRLETNLGMGAVAERFVRRCAAAAKRHPFLGRISSSASFMSTSPCTI